MELQFSKKEIDFIVKMRDINKWSFGQIADALQCPYYVEEIEETYEKNSDVAIKGSRIDKYEFVRAAYKSMLRGAAERRDNEFNWSKLNTKQLKKHEESIRKLYKRADFWLCWDLYKDNDYKSMYKPTLDHIIPVSRGGNDKVGNLQWLPRFANIWKLAETDEDWRGLVRQAPEFFIKLGRLYNERRMPKE